MAKKKEKLSLEEMLEQAIVKEEDRPYEVPGNWVWTRLQNLVSILGDGLHGTPVYSENGEYYFINGNNLNNGLIDIKDNTKKVDLEEFLKHKKQLNDRTLFVSINGTLGNVAFYNNEKIILGKSACYFNLYKNICKKYVMYLIKSEDFINYANRVATGTTIKNVSLKSMRELNIPLPPLHEQHRIVDIIESMFEKLDTAKELAQNALDSFENRKAAILHKAFKGELTAKWREENKTSKNNILTEVLTYYTESGVKKNINNILKYQESIVEINNIKNSLWYKCSIGAIGVVSNGSTPSRQNLDFWDGDISWVSSGEVRNNIIETTKERISQVGYDNSSVKMLPAGTVLIAMIGEGKTRGQSAILNIEATINQNIAAIDLNHKKVESKFMWYWLQKQYVNNREKGNGTGPQALNCERVRELDFVLPPLAEQKEIVHILDNLLDNEQRAKELCDVIEKIELMKKAILSRAFRGELGTNNPEEESAAQLLKEVLKEKI